MAMEPPMNSAHRRKLGDITNLQNQRANQQQQSMIYAEKLQKENMKLTKVLMERNKIIELNGSELQKLRINFQKVQEQNLQLAQTNTRILAEINTNKDRLKVLQHELSCKNGLLMARKFLLEGQNLPGTHCHASEDKDCVNTLGGDCESVDTNGEDHETGKRMQQSSIKSSESSSVNSLQINEEDNKKRRVTRRKNPANCEDVIGIPGESIKTTNMRRSARIYIHELGVTENLNGIHDDQEITANVGCSANDQSIGSKPEAVEPHDKKEITEKSRVSSRRQSTKVKPQEAIKDSTDPPTLHNDIVEESSQISSSVSMELKRESKNKPRGDEAEEVRKTSVGGRPLRQAAGKIKSYKEASLMQPMFLSSLLERTHIPQFPTIQTNGIYFTILSAN